MVSIAAMTIEQPSLLNCDNFVESKFDKNTTICSQKETQDIAFLSSKNYNSVIKESAQVNNSVANRYNPQDVYEAVLPFILQNLETPKNDKFLAESLEIKLVQMRAWLKRAVEDGKIKKNKRPTTYEINKSKNLSLLNN